jgi:AcrR family transcriptional regulator
VAAQPRPTQREERVRAARGRNAPPPEVRAALQRRRLLRAAASEFAERGHVGATATSIAARAGMSKATSYAHFAGGITELISRQMRVGKPKHLLELAPVIDCMIDGVLALGSQ